MIPPAIGIIDACRAERRPGETLYETAQRVLTHEAMIRTGGRQDRAARLLGVSPRAMNYNAADLGLRPKDGGR